MKLLFVGWYPNPIDKYKNVFFQNLIFALADAGNECTVISPVSIMKYRNRVKYIPREAYHTTPNNNKVKVYYPKVLSASSKQIGYFNTEIISERFFEKGALRIAKTISKKTCFDAVYGHFFLYGGLAAIKIGRKLNIPSFVAFGECDYESQIKETYGDLQHKDIEGLSGIISVSTKNAKKIDELGIFDNIPVIISPNAVDKKLFKRMDKTECREILGLPNDKFIVGFVGGFIERKGDKRLLEAVNQLDDVFLAFAGTGDAPPVGKRVLFCKPLKHEQIPILLNAVDTFCLPTLSEGSCNAVAEALACGIPVISSNLEFNDDVLNDENSIRINPTSIEEIKNAIFSLKNNSCLKESLEARSYETGKQLRIEKRAENIASFIEKNIRLYSECR